MWGGENGFYWKNVYKRPAKLEGMLRPEEGQWWVHEECTKDMISYTLAFEVGSFFDIESFESILTRGFPGSRFRLFIFLDSSSFAVQFNSFRLLKIFSQKIIFENSLIKKRIYWKKKEKNIKSKVRVKNWQVIEKKEKWDIDPWNRIHMYSYYGIIRAQSIMKYVILTSS